MVLLIDIGNTRFKYAMYNAPSVNEENMTKYISDIGSELNEQLTEEWLRQHAAQCTQIVFANVSDEKHTVTIEQWCYQMHIYCVHITTEQSFNGVLNGYQNYQQLGVDRWLALIGSHYLYPNMSSLIVDSGTATTFDVLRATGEHLGGWILPGVEVMANSVLASTARVKDTLTNIDDLAFGKTTAENLMQASWAATLGSVRQALFLIEQNVEQDKERQIKIIFTGGNGENLYHYFNSQNIHNEAVLIPKLIFVGLSRYINHDFL